jgi:hypothetical protein
MKTPIMGIDCTTSLKKIGRARASFDGLQARVEKVWTGSLVPDRGETIAAWVKRAPPMLIAADPHQEVTGDGEPWGETLITMVVQPGAVIVPGEPQG